MKKRILLLLAVLLLCGCGTEKTYYCLNGELDGDECIIENYKDAIASCRDGYTKVGYVCKERKDAHSEINCREGYTAESGMCISNEPVEPEIKYECNDKIFPDTISHTLVENMCSYEICLIREGGECLESTTMESPAITKEINCCIICLFGKWIPFSAQSAASRPPPWPPPRHRSRWYSQNEAFFRLFRYILPYYRIIW